MCGTSLKFSVGAYKKPMGAASTKLTSFLTDWFPLLSGGGNRWRRSSNGYHGNWASWLTFFRAHLLFLRCATSFL